MKKPFNCFVFLAFSFFLIFQVGINHVSSADRFAEVAEYLELLQSNDILKQIEAARRISQSGLSNPELFDFINQKLLNEYQSHPGSPKHIDLLAWLCKALASSGLPQYKATLQQVAETTIDPKIAKYASQSFAMVDEYARRNAIMNEGVDISENPEITRLINMLKSDDVTFKKDAAKIIYQSKFTSSELFDVVNEELMSGYFLVTMDDKEQLDYMAWLCKALSASRMTKYVDSLREVAENATNPKLQKYALKSYEMLLSSGN